MTSIDIENIVLPKRLPKETILCYGKRIDGIESSSELDVLINWLKRGYIRYLQLKMGNPTGIFIDKSL